MPKIILYIAMSIDGYIATEDGGVSWLDEYSDSGDDYGYSEFISNIDVNIQGANTYKQVVGFDVPYPYKSKSFVIARKELKKPQDADVEFVKGSLTEIANKAKDASIKNVWLIGGANIVQAMLEEDLIDEMIIATMPKTLGSGISLFGSNGAIIRLKLLRNKKYKSGGIISHYIVEK